MRRIFAWMALLTITFAAALASTSRPSVASGQWLLTYQGKNTNDVRWDKRLLPMLEMGLPDLPDATVRGDRLAKAAQLFLSGPPKPVDIQSDRFVTMSACVPGACEDKGLLWVDAGRSTAQLLFAELSCDAVNGETAKLSVFTKDEQLRSRLPPQFVASLKSWLGSVGVKNLTSFTVQSNEQDRINLPTDLLEVGEAGASASRRNERQP